MSVSRTILLLLMLVLTACTTAVRQGGKTPTLAIMPGIPDPANIAIAAIVAESLRKQGVRQVISGEDAMRTLGRAPQFIQGPYRRAYFDIDIDWQRTDREKIAEIQRLLGVDYLYVIWGPGQIRNGSLTDFLVWTAADIKALDINEIEVPLVVQLFAVQGAKPEAVFQHQYNVRLDKEYKSNDWVGYDSMDKLAKDLGKATGLLKGWW